MIVMSKRMHTHPSLTAPLGFHRSGRVSGLGGVYCSGWAKNGPTGIIATTMVDANNTARALAQDLEESKLGKNSLDKLSRRNALVQKLQGQAVTYEQWKAIEQWEQNQVCELAFSPKQTQAHGLAVGRAKAESHIIQKRELRNNSDAFLRNKQLCLLLFRFLRARRMESQLKSVARSRTCSKFVTVLDSVPVHSKTFNSSVISQRNARLLLACAVPTRKRCQQCTSHDDITQPFHCLISDTVNALHLHSNLRV